MKTKPEILRAIAGVCQPLTQIDEVVPSVATFQTSSAVASNAAERGYSE